MIIPRKLKVGSHTVLVRYLEMDEKNGTTDEVGAHITITLDPRLPRSRMEAVFIHEILHVLNTTMDHALLASLAEQLYQVFNENKMFR